MEDLYNLWEVYYTNEYNKWAAAEAAKKQREMRKR